MKYDYTKVYYSNKTIEQIGQFYGEDSAELESAKGGDRSLPGRIQDDIDEEKAHLNDLVLDPEFAESLKCLVDKKPISNEKSEFVKDAIAAIETIKALTGIYESAATDRAFQRQNETESRKREK